MRTTLLADGELLAKAQAVSGIQEEGALADEALRALIERESTRQLIDLGGTEPDIRDIPRRRLLPR